ncbi:unnamed protein product [Paramecium octaurelia]|uniref:Uncharacterized protein n=1 Tax=Paramecium octaurelia TaxID=43137 RepID=A0A8S1WHE0_PAROT|nr:unnamed protein product [Paramecium octaurelia]
MSIYLLKNVFQLISFESMCNQLSEQQLSQRILTIEVVKRPLESSSLQLAGQKKGKLKWIKKLFSNSFKLHYAIILKTEENGQYILHNLQDGFTSTTITDEDKVHYQQHEIYQQEQFNKVFIVQEIFDQSSQNQKYNLVSNSCIHYVNYVKQYINTYLLDMNNSATDKVKIESLLQTAKMLIKQSYQNIVNQSFDMSEITKIAQVYSKDPSFYSDIICEIISCSKKQSVWEIFGNAVIIAIISIINLIPLINGIISAGAILAELYFIWNQGDESIFKRCIRSLSILIQFALGITNNQVSLHNLYDMCSELIEKIEIVKLPIEQKIIVGSSTIMGMVFGGLLQAGMISLPALGFIPIVSIPTLCFAKIAILIVANIFSSGNPAVLSFSTYITQAISCRSNVVETTIQVASCAISAKIGLSLISIGFSHVMIFGAAGLFVGLAIIKILQKIK